jgi:hypothetical protein
VCARSRAGVAGCDVVMFVATLARGTLQPAEPVSGFLFHGRSKIALLTETANFGASLKAE